MGSEELRLRWEDFLPSLAETCSLLQAGGELTDVTLVCAEGQVAAHRLVLAAASPLLRSLLARAAHPHPLLFLVGLGLADLRHLVDFIYQGEVVLTQAALPSFLAAAGELQVKGLTGQERGEGGAGAGGGEVWGGGRMEHTGISLLSGASTPLNPSIPITPLTTFPLSLPDSRHRTLHTSLSPSTPPPLAPSRPPLLPASLHPSLPSSLPPHLLGTTSSAIGESPNQALVKKEEESEDGEEVKEREEVEERKEREEAMVRDRSKLNRTLEGMVERTGERNLHRCTSCGKVSRDRSSAMVHCELHLHLSIPCTICGRTFRTRNALSKHLGDAHNQKRAYALNL